MPIGPDEASEGSEELKRQVSALAEIIDKYLLEVGDYFAITPAKYKTAGIEVPTSRLLQAVERVYESKGWADVNIAHVDGLEGDYIRCSFKGSK